MKWLLIIFVFIGVVFLTGCNKVQLDKSILKESIQTNEYFSDKPDNNKYFINSENELNKFSELYSNILNRYSSVIENNSLFVMVFEESSGSTKLSLEKVELKNKKVNFIIKRDVSENGTDDMAFWYLIGIIPNKKLEKLDISDWKKPSDVLNNN